MKFAKIALFAALTGVMVLSSCKKDDEPVPFDNSKDVVMELSWTITETNGSTSYTYAGGNSYVDLDLYIDDASFAGGTNFSSTSGSSFESITIPTSTTSQKYYFGVKYFSRTITPSSGYYYLINYTIKAYPSGNVGAAKYFTGTINTNTTSADSDVVYFSNALDKSSSGYVFSSVSAFSHTY